MALQLDKPVESPFKTKGSLGHALVDGNDVDVSNINCYLQLLAQTANKKEKLRRKKRRERREKKKLAEGKDRKKSKKHRHSSKAKEVTPDTPQSEVDVMEKKLDKSQDVKHTNINTPTEHRRGGLIVAPTLPTHTSRQVVSGRLPQLEKVVHSAGTIESSPMTTSSSSTSSMEVVPTVMGVSSSSTPTVELTNPGFLSPRSGSWSQFVVDHQMPREFITPHPHATAYHRYPRFHYQPRMRSLSPAMMMNSQPMMTGIDPSTAELLQLMTEHQSCSNPSFNFSSSFSADSLAALTGDEALMNSFLSGNPTMYSSPSSHHHLQQQGSIDVELPSPSFPSCDSLPGFYQTTDPLSGILSSSSSFGIDAIEDRDGTYANLEFLEAALAHDIGDQ